MSDRASTLLVLARGWRLIPAVAALGLFVIAASTRCQLALPQYFSPGGYEAPVVLLVALPVAVTAALTLDEPVSHIWQTSPRRMRVGALMRCSSVVVLAAATALLLWPETASGASLALLSITAEAAALRRLVGSQLAWMLPALHVAGACVFGVSESGVAVWAWPVAERPSAEQAIVAFGLTLVALGMTLGRLPKPSNRSRLGG